MKRMGGAALCLIVASLALAVEPDATQEKLVEPVIVELEAMDVVGIQTLFSMKCNLIPELWERFGSRMQEIKNVARKDVAVEVSYDMQGTPEEQTFFVLAGLIVESYDELPEGMTHKHVPAHKYAMFTHYGPISRIYETYDHIYNELLPNSAYDIDEAACTIEWYDERFKMESPDSEYDIYAPVKDKQE